MEFKLEVLSSVSIKEKKPWPRLGWLQEVKVYHNLVASYIVADNSCMD